MPVFSVTAISLNEFGEALCDPRIEEIDTDNNEIFSDCYREDEVEDRYLAYWNRLNGFTNSYPHGKVVVLKVEA